MKCSDEAAGAAPCSQAVSALFALLPLPPASLHALRRGRHSGVPRRPTRRAAHRAVPVAQRAHRHREQHGVDSGKATEGSPKGCHRWRRRNHTGIDSNDNHVFRRNADFEILQISKLICSRSRRAGFPACPVQGKVMKGGRKRRAGSGIRGVGGSCRRGSTERTREAPLALRAARGASEQFLAAAYFPT